MEKTFTRKMARSPSYFFRGADKTETVIGAVESAPMKGILTCAPLITGDESSMTYWTRKKGLIDTQHQHDDHESIAILLSGKLRLVIDGEEFIAGPGDCWVHPRGVPHFSEALEDCVQIEVKSPPIRTWSQPGD